MDTHSLIELAKSRSRAEFVAVLPHRFLVLDEGLYEASHVGFSTQLVVAAALERAAATATRRPTVLAITKAPGSPYTDRVSIGRTRNCDLVLRDPSVSKLHAHFNLVSPQLELIDTDSQNGTRVNGRVLIPNRPVAVGDGDILVFGNVSTRVVAAASLYDLLR